MTQSAAGGRPRVAHVLPFPAVGGTEIATLRVMNAAREHGFDGIAFHTEGARPVRELFEGAGFATRSFLPVEPSYRSPARFLASSLRLARAFRTEGVAIVHAADMLGAFHAGYAARLAGARLICHVRNRYARLSRRDRSFLLPVQQFVFVSADTWRHFGLAVPARRGTVLYDGIDVNAAAATPGDAQGVRQEFGIPVDAPVIGMVARVAPQKDYPTLIRAAQRVVARFPDARFLIVGDCSGTEALREHYAATRGLVASAGLGAHFVFTDFRADVPRLLSSFDIFVLSTHWEGLPLVLLEAMAHGKPTVATNVDGIPELITDEQSGLLYAHEDWSGLAERLIGLLADRRRLETMGRAGQRVVAERFSRAAFSRNVARLYSGMLGRKPRAASLERARLRPEPEVQ